MTIITFMLYFFLILGFFYNFSKKVSLLLTLEGMMLILLWNFLHHQMEIMSCFFVMVLSIFMVLDSVLGMTLLICSSKTLSVESFNFTSF